VKQYELPIFDNPLQRRVIKHSSDLKTHAHTSKPPHTHPPPSSHTTCFVSSRVLSFLLIFCCRDEGTLLYCPFVPASRVNHKPAENGADVYSNPETGASHLCMIKGYVSVRVFLVLSRARALSFSFVRVRVFVCVCLCLCLYLCLCLCLCWCVCAHARVLRTDVSVCV